MIKTSKAMAPWQPRLLAGNTSLSGMLCEWIRDRRMQKKARRRESKGRWAGKAVRA
jgi:hypothetical protein